MLNNLLAFLKFPYVHLHKRFKTINAYTFIILHQIMRVDFWRNSLSWIVNALRYNQGKMTQQPSDASSDNAKMSSAKDHPQLTIHLRDISAKLGRKRLRTISTRNLSRRACHIALS